MNALQVDPATGFLTADNNNSFTAEKKVEFLAMARKYADQRLLPPIGEMCDQAGVDYDTFATHLRRDEEFHKAWEQIKKRTYFGLAHELSVKANSKNGIIANLAALKYLERGKFSEEETNQNHEIRDIKRLFDVFKTSVIPTEAEITSTPLKDASNSTCKLADIPLPSENMQYNSSNQKLSEGLK